MSAPTPGPWRTHSTIGRKSEPGIVADAAPCIIAIMGNHKEWPAEAEANARLIASAPELLQAAKDSLEALIGEGFDQNCETVLVLKAAIAKAEGSA